MFADCAVPPSTVVEPVSLFPCSRTMFCAAGLAALCSHCLPGPWLLPCAWCMLAGCLRPVRFPVLGPSAPPCPYIPVAYSFPVLSFPLPGGSVPTSSLRRQSASSPAGFAMSSCMDPALDRLRSSSIPAALCALPSCPRPLHPPFLFDFRPLPRLKCACVLL